MKIYTFLLLLASNLDKSCAIKKKSSEIAAYLMEYKSLRDGSPLMFL